MENEPVETLSFKPSKDVLQTLFLGIYPFVLYGWGIYRGDLPMLQNWHDFVPVNTLWSYSFPGLLSQVSIWALSIMAFWNFANGILQGAESKDWTPFFRRLGLAVLQTTLALVQLITIFSSIA